MEIKVADEVWISTALLHYENPSAKSFSNALILERIKKESIFGVIRPGIQTHIVSHCVANKPAQPNTCRMLYGLPDGTKRLFRDTDEYDPSRKNGKTTPNERDIPEKYHYLLNWYNNEFNQNVNGVNGKINLPPPPPPPKTKIAPLTENQLKEFSYKCPTPRKPSSCKECDSFMGEDEVKTALEAVLMSEGWNVTTSMGKKHGVDITASHKEKGTMMIEAKGEGSRNPMRVNYFLMVLGELLQKMDNPSVQYGLAFPAHRQYAGLIAGLPDWIKNRLKLRVFLVKRQDKGVYEVGFLEYNSC